MMDQSINRSITVVTVVTGVNGSFLSISTNGLMVLLSVDFVTLSINVENPKAGGHYVLCIEMEPDSAWPRKRFECWCSTWCGFGAVMTSDFRRFEHLVLLTSRHINGLPRFEFFGQRNTGDTAACWMLQLVWLRFFSRHVEFVEWKGQTFPEDVGDSGFTVFAGALWATCSPGQGSWFIGTLNLGTVNEEFKYRILQTSDHNIGYWRLQIWNW